MNISTAINGNYAQKNPVKLRNIGAKSSYKVKMEDKWYVHDFIYIDIPFTHFREMITEKSPIFKIIKKLKKRKTYEWRQSNNGNPLQPLYQTIETLTSGIPQIIHTINVLHGPLGSVSYSEVKQHKV